MRPKAPNPLLCERCQIWADIWALCGTFSKREPTSLHKLLANEGCLVCQTIGVVVETRRRSSKTLSDWPASRVSVYDGGSYFLDGGVFPPKSSYRIDSLDPTKSTIRLLISLEVTFLSEEPQSSMPQPEISYLEGSQSEELYPENDNRKVEPKLALTPQFCFHYSTSDTSDTPHLLEIEP
jgi:hypothetical protein